MTIRIYQPPVCDNKRSNTILLLIACLLVFARGIQIRPKLDLCTTRAERACQFTSCGRENCLHVSCASYLIRNLEKNPLSFGLCTDLFKQPGICDDGCQTATQCAEEFLIIFSIGGHLFAFNVEHTEHFTAVEQRNCQ